MTIKEKLNKLITAITKQNDTQNEITIYAKQKGLSDLIENVNKEKMVFIKVLASCDCFIVGKSLSIISKNSFLSIIT